MSFQKNKIVKKTKIKLSKQYRFIVAYSRRYDFQVYPGWFVCIFYSSSYGSVCPVVVYMGTSIQIQMKTRENRTFYIFYTVFGEIVFYFCQHAQTIPGGGVR